MSFWQQLVHFVSAGHSSTPPLNRRKRDKRQRPLRLEALETRQLFAIYTVDSLLDTVDAGDGHTTLREAVALAEADAGGDTIKFDATLAGGTIELSTVGSTTVGPSALTINTEITIDGRDAPLLTIGRDSSVSNLRLFYVSGSGNLTLDSITLSGGQITGYAGGSPGSTEGLGGGGGAGPGFGGAIYNRGKVTIISSTLSDNSATGGTNSGTSSGTGGGGGASMTAPGGNATSSTGGSGGGVNGGAGGAINVNGSLGYYGGGGGGGGGSVDAARIGKGGTGGFGAGGGGAGSKPQGSQLGGDGGFGGGAGGSVINGGTPGAGGAGAGMGGAIFNDLGTLTVINSTLTRNSAIGGAAYGSGEAGQGLGGAVFVRGGTVKIYNSTLDSNTVSTDGGAIYGLSQSGVNVSLELVSSILSNTSGGHHDGVLFELAGSIQASGNMNLIESASGMAQYGLVTYSADPQLGNLTHNGGATLTLLPDAQSTVVGAGSNLLLLPHDQRDGKRTVGSLTDIGAVQATLVTTPFITSIARTTPTDAATNAGSLAFTVTFDQDVTGFDATQLELAGAGAVDCTIDNVSGSGSVYTVSVTNSSAQGELELYVDQGAIKNAHNELFDGDVWVDETYQLVVPIVVDSLLDTVDANDGVTTLREAVAQAETLADVSWIWFDSSLAGGTIELATIGDTSVGNSALAITTEIVIDGSAAPFLTIGRSSSQSNLRQFYIDTTGDLTIQSITVSGGQITGGMGASGSGYGNGGGSGGGGAGLGGAFYNRGSLTIVSSTLNDNSATGGASGFPVSVSSAGAGGGGTAGNGHLGSGSNPGSGGPGGGGTGGAVGTVGSAGGFGGGAGGGGSGRFVNAGTGGAGGFGGGGGGGGGSAGSNTVGAGGIGGFGGGNGASGNNLSFNTAAGGRGGGGAGMGGAIFNDDATLTIINSTLTDNTATGGAGVQDGQGLGGAIFSRGGTTSIYSSTIADNLAYDGTALLVYQDAGTASVVNLYNSILSDDGMAAGVPMSNVDGGGSIVVSGYYNLTNGASGVEMNQLAYYFDFAHLGPLTDNGGPTKTMMPTPSSQAIGNGWNETPLTTDQIGNPRALDNVIDLGAVQWCDPASITSITRTTPSTQTTSANSVEFTITIDEDVTGMAADQILLTGTAAAGSSVTNVSGSGSTYTVTVDTTGANGTLGLTVLTGQVKDLDGNQLVTTPLSSETYSIVHAPPAAPVITSPTETVVTTAPTYNLTGTVEANGLVKVYRGSTVVAQQQLSGGATSFSISAPLSVKSDAFTVTVTDGYGQESTATAAPLITRPNYLAVGTNSANKTTPLVNVYDASTGDLVSSFLAYEKGFNGGVRVTTADLDNNGTLEILVTPASKRRTEVKVFSVDGVELTQFEFVASKSTQLYGSSVTTGDVDGDGYTDVILGAGKGQTSHIRVFRNNFAQTPGQAFSSAPVADFKAFPDRYKSGVSVTAGDIDDDGKFEIIVGSNAGQIAQVAVFSILDTNLFTFEQSHTFRPYGDKFKGGVSVSAGDTDGDGKAEIITAPGAKGQTLIQIHNGETGALIGTPFAAFPTSKNLPVNIVLKDLDGDSRIDEIFAAAAAEGNKYAIKRYRTSGQPSLSGLDFVFETLKDFKGGINLG